MSLLTPSGKLLFPVVCSVGFFLGVEAGSFQFVLLKISEEFGLSGAAMGSLVSVQFFAMLICPLIVGRISDLVAKKKIAAVFTFVFAVGCLLCTLCSSLTGFIVGIFIVGGSFTTAQNATLAALAEAYGSRSGRYVSICQCLYSLGAMSGPLFASFAILRMGFDWRVVFYACAIAFFLLFLLILGTKFVKTEAIPATETESVSIRSIFSATLVLLLLSMLLYMAAENGFTYFLDTFFTSGLSAPELSAIALSSFWIGTAAARLIGSFLHRQQRKLVAGCFLLSVIIIGAITFSGSALAVAVLCCLLGFIFGPVWPYLVSQANEEFPRYTGTVTSLMSIAGSIGGTTIPVVMGAASDMAGIRASYLLLAALSLLGGLFYLFYYRIFKNRHNA